MAAAPADARAAVARGHADALVRWSREVLEAPAALAIDAELRRDLQGLTGPFAERMRPVYERWSIEALDRSGADLDVQTVWQGLTSRFLNALATWRLRDGGAEHQEALRSVALEPAVCRRMTEMRASWPEVASMLQQLPAAQRAAALVGEARLLEAWAKKPEPYELAPNAPVPGTDIRRWVEGLRQAQASPQPMPPALAGRLLPEPPRELTAPHRCALRQWWLSQRLQALGPAPAAEAVEQVWRAWRLLLAQDMIFNGLSEPFPTPDGEAGYPRLARQLELTGTTTVEVTLDTRRRYADGQVLERRLAIPGLPPGTPLPGLQHLLDGASLAKARSVIDAQAGQAPAADAKPRGAKVTLELVWKLE